MPSNVLNINNMNKQLFYKQLLQEKRDLQSSIEAINVLIERYKPENENFQGDINFTEVEKNKIEFNNGYDKNWVQEDKVFYALKKLGKGTVDEVTKQLILLDNSFDNHKAKTAATIKCSRLYQDGKIGAVKMGKKYKYFIKEE